jgi:hypothetical protein
MARRICRARDEGNKQVQTGTGMPMLIDSEELRTQRMPSPNKLHHFRRPRRDTVSFRNAVVTPSEVEQVPPFSQTAERHRVFSHCSGDT